MSEIKFKLFLFVVVKFVTVDISVGRFDSFAFEKRN